MINLSDLHILIAFKMLGELWVGEHDGGKNGSQESFGAKAALLATSYMNLEPEFHLFGSSFSSVKMLW